MNDSNDPYSCFGSDEEDPICEEEDEDHVTGSNLAREANVRLGDAAAAAIDGILPVSSPSFEVFETPLSGKGLRALKGFSPGDEILRESAAMRIPNQQSASSLEEAQAMHERIVQNSFDNLHPTTQGAVMDLSSCRQYQDDDDGDNNIRSPVVGVYQTNSFKLGGEERGGLFLTIARINHSCRPNCNHIWRPDLQKTVIFATKEIGIGDEIFTTYGPSECLDTSGRKSYLQERFNFDCCCEMCKEGNRIGGDDRMKELNVLQEDISIFSAGGDFEKAIDAVERCLTLLKEQGIGSGAFAKPILHYGYQISLEGLHNLSMAQDYLSKELSVVNACEGYGSPTSLKIQQMLDNEQAMT